MITDEIIFETAVIFEEPAELWQGQIVFSKHSLLAYTRRIIKLAQEVTPLMVLPVTDDQDGMIGICHTDFGSYEFYQYDSGHIVALDNVCVRSALSSHDEAIAAAQSDFNRRVLQNLIHGVVSDEYHRNF